MHSYNEIDSKLSKEITGKALGELYIFASNARNYQGCGLDYGGVCAPP